MQGQGGASFCIFINDGFRAGWCHGITIPIVRAFECFVCGNVGLDSGFLVCRSRLMESCTCEAILSHSWIGTLTSVVPRALMN